MPTRYPKLPMKWSDPHEHLFKMTQSLNGALNGQINNVLVVTLRADETTTEISDDRIHPNTVPILVPKTASAGATAWRYSATRGKVTLTHDSDPASDRSFGVLLFG
jgi:hypothetical protein